MEGLNILPMGEEHIKAIAALERECFSTPWSEGTLRAQLGRPSSVFFAACLDGEVVANLGMERVMDEGNIDNVAFFPANRRKGEASALLGALFAYGEKEGMAFLTLEVRPSNQGARALYEAHGFQQVGERKNFYQNPVENALLLTRYLDE